MCIMCLRLRRTNGAVFSWQMFVSFVKLPFIKPHELFKASPCICGLVLVLFHGEEFETRLVTENFVKRIRDDRKTCLSDN